MPKGEFSTSITLALHLVQTLWASITKHRHPYMTSHKQFTTKVRYKYISNLFVIVSRTNCLLQILNQLHYVPLSTFKRCLL